MRTMLPPLLGRPLFAINPKFRNLGIVLVLVVVLVLGAFAFCAGKGPDVLQLFCSVSLIVKHSDSRGRGRRRARGRLLNFGVWINNRLKHFREYVANFRAGTPDRQAMASIP